MISQERIHGLVIWGATLAHHIERQDLYEFCVGFKPIPVVNIGPALEGIPGVTLDNYQAMREGIRHLVIDHGYRKIVFVRGPQNHPEEQDRFRAYHDVLEEFGIGLNQSLVLPGTLRKSSGREAIVDLLDQRGLLPKRDFDAVVAANDMTAIGVIAELQSRGLVIPDDVAVIGLDDAEEGRSITPPLTTVAYLPFEQGRYGAELLFGILNGNQKTDHEYLTTKIIIRQSCGCSDPTVKFAGDIGNQKNILAIDSSYQNIIEQLSLSTAKELQSPPSKEVISWIIDLFSAFNSDINKNEDSRFLLVLGRILPSSQLIGVQPANWNNVISAWFKNIRN